MSGNPVVTTSASTSSLMNSTEEGVTGKGRVQSQEGVVPSQQMPTQVRGVVRKVQEGVSSQGRAASTRVWERICLKNMSTRMARINN